MILKVMKLSHSKEMVLCLIWSHGGIWLVEKIDNIKTWSGSIVLVLLTVILSKGLIFRLKLGTNLNSSINNISRLEIMALSTFITLDKERLDTFNMTCLNWGTKMSSISFSAPLMSKLKRSRKPRSGPFSGISIVVIQVLQSMWPLSGFLSKVVKLVKKWRK